MLPGVRPSIIRASSPTATMRGRLPLSSWASATTDGSVRTIPFPRTYTITFAVPRSMPIWRANKRCPFSCGTGAGPSVYWSRAGRRGSKGSRTDGDEDEVGQQAGEESDADAPSVPQRRAQLASGREELADHEHDRAGGDGQEEHRDRGRRERVPDDRAREVRAATDDPDQPEQRPARPPTRERRGDPEGLGHVVQSEADHEGEREREVTLLRRAPDRQALGEVV